MWWVIMMATIKSKTKMMMLLERVQFLRPNLTITFVSWNNTEILEYVQNDLRYEPRELKEHFLQQETFFF